MWGKNPEKMLKMSKSFTLLKADLLQDITGSLEISKLPYYGLPISMKEVLR